MELHSTSMLLFLLIKRMQFPLRAFLCKSIEKIPENKHKNHIGPERKKEEVHDNEARKSDEISMFMNVFLVFHNSKFYV